MLLACAIATTPDQSDKAQQIDTLDRGFVKYLQEKQAAGIVNVTEPGVGHRSLHNVLTRALPFSHHIVWVSMGVRFDSLGFDGRSIRFDSLGFDGRSIRFDSIRFVGF